MKFGDVIVMDDVYAKIRLSDSDFLGVVNLRTGDSGDLPTACLSVLAVTKEPEREFKVSCVVRVSTFPNFVNGIPAMLLASLFP